MNDTIELPTKVVVNALEAFIACFDELGAINFMKYAALDDVNNAIIARKRLEDEKVWKSAFPALEGLVQELDARGIEYNTFNKGPD